MTCPNIARTGECFVGKGPLKLVQVRQQDGSWKERNLNEVICIKTKAKTKRN